VLPIKENQLLCLRLLTVSR